jgi:tetratricopeptide (TPR) repeat protein
MLGLFGISETPTIDEDQSAISEATVDASDVHERLSTLVQHAILGCMDHMAPDRLGSFYDNNKRIESALQAYRKALPFAVRDAHRDGGSVESRRRLAQLLVRIATLEATGSERDSRAMAGNHFDAAIALAPEYTPARVARGEFLMRITREPSGDIGNDSQEARQNYQKAIGDLRIVTDPRNGPDLDGFLGAPSAKKLVGRSLIDLANAEACDALASKDTHERSASLEFAIRHARLATDEQVKRQSLEAYVTSKYISILQSTDCIRDFLGCTRKSDDGPEGIVVEQALLHVVRECVAGGPVIADLGLEYPYLSHAAIAINYIQSMKAAHDERRYSDNEGNLLKLDEVIMRARRRLHLDEVDAGRTRTTRKGATHDLRRDAELQAQLEATLVTIRPAVKWDSVCAHKERIPISQERDLEEVRRLMQVRTERSPSDVDAKEGQALILAMAPHVTLARLVAAERDAEAGVTLEPESAYRRSTFALVELRLGKLKMAVKNLEVAAALSPNDPTVHYKLGFALIQIGDVDRAQDEWRYASQLDPNRWQEIRHPMPGCTPKVGL